MNYTELGYAKPDHTRGERQGVGEVIYGQSKTAEQIAGIVAALREHGAENIIVTRVSKRKAALSEGRFPFTYYAAPKLLVAYERVTLEKHGKIVIACGGTSDVPVCEEAAVTAETLGDRVVRLYDVGVAGIHRLLSNADVFDGATCVIAVAGMEGALPSVIGGLVSCPVIAVPTSVGYGANFGGVTALLAMLNSCAAGVSVVNIDNGFGAAVIAHRVNVQSEKWGMTI